MVEYDTKFWGKLFHNFTELATKKEFKTVFSF